MIVRGRPTTLRLVLCSLLAAAGCDPASPFSFSPPGGLTFSPTSSSAFSRKPTDPTDADELIAELLNAVNAEREKIGLAPLKLSLTLSDMAERYADRLIAGDFFAHVDPAGGASLVARAKSAGYSFYKVGENLAAGQRDVDSAMKDWLSSPTHRANILDPDFTELGVAIRDGGRYGRYWVQEFGRPLGQ